MAIISAKIAEITLATYIHELDEWPKFTWEPRDLAAKLASVRHRQGLLLGRMRSLGFQLQEEAVLQTLTEDVLKSSEIEGELLDKAQVRSSIARRLGMEVGGLIPADRNVEGVVEMMLDATQLYSKPLTRSRMHGWHAALFPTGRSGMYKITVGDWREDADGPMQVVSGPIGKEWVHFEAPAAPRVAAEMQAFLKWFNDDASLDPVLRSAVAHLWFVTIHPFDDGNGRIARAISDMCLARSEDSPQRFYSMSAQIREEKEDYYKILESTQKGTLDITRWLDWFLSCLDRAIEAAERTLADVFRKTRFWETHAAANLNPRQRQMLVRMLDGFVGNLTSTKWAQLTKSSQDTASRDIDNLVNQGILTKAGAGRSTHYLLNSD